MIGTQQPPGWIALAQPSKDGVVEWHGARACSQILVESVYPLWRYRRGKLLCGTSEQTQQRCCQLLNRFRFGDGEAQIALAAVRVALDQSAWL